MLAFPDHLHAQKSIEHTTGNGKAWASLSVLCKTTESKPMKKKPRFKNVAPREIFFQLNATRIKWKSSYGFIDTRFTCVSICIIRNIVFFILKCNITS